MIKKYFAVFTLLFCGCSVNRNDSVTNLSSDNLDTAQLDMIGLQGKWTLKTYCIDCESIYFELDSNYILSFNEHDNSFGMATDCNVIGGKFGGSNDTIRFEYIAVTEMACEKMKVEEDMLRLFNDTTSYAILAGDSLFFTAPYIGNATFVKKSDTTPNNE